LDQLDLMVIVLGMALGVVMGIVKKVIEQEENIQIGAIK